MATHSQKYGYEDERFQNAVSQSFHCSICLNVLKEPKMCRNNEHVFCSACITRHLANSSTCPQCIEELTVETLRPAPRLLFDCLSQLTINCDYFNRGCREFVHLDDLQVHVMSCGFAPVTCSNNECGMEIDKKDRIHHETEVCDFRRVKCHDCGEMKKEIEEMKEQLNQLPEMKDRLLEMKGQLNQLPEMKDRLLEMKGQLNQLPEIIDQLNQLPEMKEQLNQLPEMVEQLNELTQLPEMKAQLSSLKEDVNEVRAMMVEVLHKMNNVEHASQVPLHVNTTNEDILIAGGYGKDGRPSSSTETFSWNKRAWTPLPAMAERRSGASSFVYENQVFVAGGFTGGSEYSDRMKVLKVDEQPLRWTESPAKLPYKSNYHKTVVYQNRLIHIGGYNKTEQKHSDTISEVLLTPPYSKKMLCRMPQPRLHHGVEIFNDKVMILGGKTSYSSKDSVNSVLEYDVNKNECKQMPPLPRAVCEMATVRWGDKVVVMGGKDKEDKVLSDVLMYDCKTGERNVLPSMKHKRCGCTAIITRNVIVVMGGWNRKDIYLSSVECFTLGSNSWEELPPMIEPRHIATAVIMPFML